MRDPDDTWDDDHCGNPYRPCMNPSCPCFDIDPGILRTDLIGPKPALAAAPRSEPTIRVYEPLDMSTIEYTEILP